MRIPIRGNAKQAPQMNEKDDAFSTVSTIQCSGSPVALQLHPVQIGGSQQALVAQIQPPREPAQKTHHVPCDIVLVIDVSGSMGADAPVPGEGGNESTGLTVLDLVKHAALTIIETMDERDRLGIVTFASSVDVVQKLEVMTDRNKARAKNSVKNMYPKDATNLWQGILNGIRLFENATGNGKVPAVMVLTDGVPNFMCPPAGYVPKLRGMLPLPATIHTFGFGYDLRSGLLKSIAEIGNGNYAFIPDAGLIGTVFVHAVANLQSTFATNAVLKLQYSLSLEIEEANGPSVVQEVPEKVQRDGTQSALQLSLPLGNLQYGQSREIFLRVNGLLNDKDDTTLPIIEATLSFTPIDPSSARTLARETLECTQNLLKTSDLTDADIAYYDSRARICWFLSSLFPMGIDEEHVAAGPGVLSTKRAQLKQMIAKIPAKNHDDHLNKSLMEDLIGASPKGQISLALENQTYYSRWGQHYLPSLLNAHTRQVCNSFKDPGPLHYGADSPLFIACRDRLDETFDSLPPPKPSAPRRGGSAVSYAQVNMSSYRNASGPCFAGSTLVELASGRLVEIKRLRRGMKMRTPAGSRKVAAVLKTPVKDQIICRVNSVLVTPWHPISLDGKTWTFPAYATDKAVRYTGAVYSILLQRDRSPTAHALHLDGLWGVTLGHGVTTGGDVRAHAFLGDYSLVGKNLGQVGMDARGVVVSGGVERDVRSGLIYGFARYNAQTRYGGNGIVKQSLKASQLVPV